MYFCMDKRLFKTSIGTMSGQAIFHGMYLASESRLKTWTIDELLFGTGQHF